MKNFRNILSFWKISTFLLSSGILIPWLNFTSFFSGGVENPKAFFEVLISRSGKNCKTPLFHYKVEYTFNIFSKISQKISPLCMVGHQGHLSPQQAQKSYTMPQHLAHERQCFSDTKASKLLVLLTPPPIHNVFFL